MSTLPQPLAHFLGYRSTLKIEPCTLLQWLNTFIGTVIDLCKVAAVFVYTPSIPAIRPPALIASLGASAVLQYNAIHVSLAQPRNAVLGQTLAALVGVSVSKLFQQSHHSNQLMWISGAIGCGSSSVAMGVTVTLHAPGGATALLASIDPAVLELG